MATAKIGSALVREIPFRDETDAITLSLDEMTDPKSWPPAAAVGYFSKPSVRLTRRRSTMLWPRTRMGVPSSPRRSPGSALRRERVAFQQSRGHHPGQTQQPDHLQAIELFEGGLAGLSRMLERLNVESVLSELEKIENTTVGNLVAFMHAYNLRFTRRGHDAQADSAAYRELYPILAGEPHQDFGQAGARTRQRLLSQAQPQPIDNPTAIFYGLDPNATCIPSPSPLLLRLEPRWVA